MRRHVQVLIDFLPKPAEGVGDVEPPSVDALRAAGLAAGVQRPPQVDDAAPLAVQPLL